MFHFLQSPFTKDLVLLDRVVAGQTPSPEAGGSGTDQRRSRDNVKELGVMRRTPQAMQVRRTTDAPAYLLTLGK